MANKDYNKEDGVWRTIGGRRVFIKNGQSLADAMKESGKFKSAKKDNEDDKEKSIIHQTPEEAKAKLDKARADQQKAQDEWDKNVKKIKEETIPDFELTGDDFTDFVNEMKHNNQLDKVNGREETVDAQYVIERLQGINTPESRRALRELNIDGDRLKDEDVIKALEIGSKDPYGDFSKEEVERVKAVEINDKAEPEGPELDEYDREKLEGLIGNGIPQDAYDEFVDITGEEPTAIQNAIGQLADDLTGYEELNDFEDEYGAIGDYDRLDNLYEDLNTYLDDKIDEGEIDESFKDDVINRFGDAEDTANSQMDEEIQSYLDKASGKVKAEEVTTEDESKNWTKDDYIKRNKDLEEAKKRVQKQYDDDMADARATGNDKLEESSKKAREEQLKAIDELQKRNQDAFKQYKAKQNAPENNPIQEMADERVKEKQNALQMNKMLLENMNKNNIDKLPDGTTKDDLEFKAWENQNYIDKANGNFENLKKNTISEAEKEKYMKENNLTMFTSRDEYNYLKNKESALKTATESKPSKYTADEEDILDRYSKDYGYDGEDRVKNLKSQIDYMRNPNESINQTAKRLVEGGDFLIYNGDIQDYLKERNIKFNDDNFFEKYKEDMAEKIERLYNEGSERKATSGEISDAIRSQSSKNNSKKEQISKRLASNSGQENISKDTKVMRYGDDYIVTKNGANKGEFKTQEEAEKFARGLGNSNNTNKAMNDAIREKAGRKKTTQNETPKATMSDREVRNIKTKKALKSLVDEGKATDITTLGDKETKALRDKHGHLEKVKVITGTYGMNGALLRSSKTGEYFVITSRNSNLFYWV